MSDGKRKGRGQTKRNSSEKKNQKTTKKVAGSFHPAAIESESKTKAGWTLKRIGTASRKKRDRLGNKKRAG